MIPYRPSTFQTGDHDELARLAHQAELFFYEELEALKAVGMPLQGKGLEVGCGTGNTAWRLMFATGGTLSIRGIDVDPTAVTSALSRIEAEEGDATKLPFLDDSFDMAYSRLVLRHLPSSGPMDALREQVRVVKPGGWVGAIDAVDSSLVLSPEPDHFSRARAGRRSYFLERNCHPEMGALLYGTMVAAGLQDVGVRAVTMDSAMMGRSNFSAVVLDTFVQAWKQAFSPSDISEACVKAGIEKWAQDRTGYGAVTLFIAGGWKP